MSNKRAHWDKVEKLACKMNNLISGEKKVKDEAFEAILFLMISFTSGLLNPGSMDTNHPTLFNQISSLNIMCETILDILVEIKTGGKIHKFTSDEQKEIEKQFKANKGKATLEIEGRKVEITSSDLQNEKQGK